MTLSEINSINSLRNFYEDSEIFITGGSGYIGKVLIEKLLRSCTRIKKIYLLLRTKKNKSLDERVKAIWDSMVRFYCVNILRNVKISVAKVNQQ